MTTEAPAPPDRILRECDCPPWHARCIHREDGTGLVLIEPFVPRRHNSHAISRDQFLVYRLEDRVPCPLCGEMAGYVWDALFCGADFDAALAAFHAAEEALLRGDLS